MSEDSVFLDSSCPEVRQAIETLSRSAPSRAPVLIVGESGTGKTTLARWLHDRSPEPRGTFQTVFCHPDSDEIGVSNSFEPQVLRGVASGGADVSRKTIYLDEVSDLPMSAQSKLVIVLERAGFETLSGRDAPFRIVASMSQDPLQEIAAGRLHRNLYHRINVVQVKLPPLRERMDDVIPLGRHILHLLAARLGRTTPVLDNDTLKLLLAYHWPANIRELRNEMERALLVTTGDLVQTSAFSENVRFLPRPACSVGGDFTLEDIERAHIERLVSRSASFDAAARILGIDISTLWRKRKRYVRHCQPSSDQQVAATPSRTSDSGAA